MIDSRKIEDLHPTLQRGAKELIKRAAEFGWPVLITSTFRDYAKQDALYAQGRTTPGAIVTNAKAGYSNHNFRIAFDICKNVKGKEYADTAFFKAVGAIWKGMGGVWGGDFKSPVDMPHFEYTNGLTTAQLRSGQTLKVDAKMKWEAASAPTSATPVNQAENLAVGISSGVPYVFSTAIKAGARVTITPGAVYGGLNSATRGKAVPQGVYASKKYTVSYTDRHNGEDEALLKEITSWVALKYLTLA